MIDQLLKLGQWLAVGVPCQPKPGEEMSRWCMLQNIICFVMRIIAILLIWFLMRDGLAVGGDALGIGSVIVLALS